MSEAAREAVRENLREIKSGLAMDWCYYSSVFYLFAFMSEGVISRVEPNNDKAVREIIKASEKDRRAWYALDLLFRRSLKQGIPMSASLRDFISDVLAGERLFPPESKGRNPIKNFGRDIAVIEAVRIALNADSSLCLTRNEATEKESASDIVAQELRTIGIKLSPESISRIASKTREYGNLFPYSRTESHPFLSKKRVFKK